MTRFQANFTRNPLRMDAKRMYRRFLYMGMANRRAGNAGIAVLGCLYALIAYLLYTMGDFSGPMFVINAELVIIVLLPELAFYGVIAGEKERRSWDLLRSAPLTDGQIIFGKFLAAGSVPVLIWIGSLPLIGITLINTDNLFTSHRFGFGQAFLASLVPLAVALMLVALTIFLSARSKTSLLTLCLSLGAAFLWIVVWPIILGMMGISATAITSLLNPFAVVNNFQLDLATGEPTSWYTPVVTSLVVFPLLTFALLYFAERTLIAAQE